MQDQDDIGSAYVDRRMAAVNLNPGLRAAMERRKAKELEAPQAPTEEKKPVAAPVPPEEEGGGILSTAGAIASDVAVGAFESPKAVLGGLRDAAQAVIDLGDMFPDYVMEITDPETGEIDFDLMSGEDFEAKGGERFDTLPEVSDPTSNTGHLIKGVTQFMAGFLPTMKAMQGVQKIGTLGKAMISGSVADFSVFDAHDARLSNLIQEFPRLENPVNDFLAADPDDPEVVGRLKNAVEGLGLGVAAEGFVQSVRAVAKYRAAKKLEGDELKSAGELEAEAKGLPATIDEPEADLAIGNKDAPAFELVDVDPAKITDGTAEAGDKALNINLEKINTSDDVMAVIEATAKEFEASHTAAGRGTVSHAETQRLADMMGMSPEDLLSRRQGQALNAHEALAARNMLVSSGEQLVGLAKKASGPDASEADLFRFRRAAAVHEGIQRQVSGMTAEAGRALNAFKIESRGASSQAKMINELLSMGKGVDLSKEMAEKMSMLDSPEAIARMAKDLGRVTDRDVLLEVWINALLSGPHTHVVNVLSNTITAAWQVPERALAASFGDTVDKGEIVGQLFGIVQGAKEGIKLAAISMRTGEPQFDQLAKTEQQQFRSFTPDNLENSGWIGRGIDLLATAAAGGNQQAKRRGLTVAGNIIRTPGRVLTASDDFFKSVAYRMEVNALAWRTAHGEGLEGDALARRIAEIVNDPPENVMMGAQAQAKYQTFTNDLSESKFSSVRAMKSVQKFSNELNPAGIPLGRIVMPFIRTPTNVLAYSLERTPMAFASKAVRDDILRGGPARDLALARISMGSMILAVAGEMALSGQMTGGGPSNGPMRSALRRQGWQPYSFKVGDQWIAYNRLDPVGMTLGLAADVSEITAQLDDPDATNMSAALLYAVANNITNKTYMQGLGDAIAITQSMSPELGAGSANKFFKNLAGSLIPTGVSHIERAVDPTLRATRTMLDQMQSRIPGYSDELPPRRNMWGEPVVLGGGWGPDALSPLYTSKIKESPIDKEMYRLGMRIGMPRPVVRGVELDPRQEDTYIQLSAGTGELAEKNGIKPLKELLDDFVTSDAYKGLPDTEEGPREQMVRFYVMQYRERAQAIMMAEDDEFRLNVIGAEVDKAKKKAGIEQ